MTDRPEPLPLLQGLHIADFTIRTLDDEIRVDGYCVDLIKHLYLHLTRVEGRGPEQAGELCRGADYFLREFIIADRRDNLFAIDAGRVCQFAAHWYIIRSLEPNMAELGSILNGAAACYRFLAGQGLVEQVQAEAIAAACADREYYARRIEEFWSIDRDGYDAWRQACPLKPAVH